MNYKALLLDMLRSGSSPVKRILDRNKCLRPDNLVKIQYCSEIVNTVFEKEAFIAHHVSCINAFIGNHTSVGRFTKIRDAEIGKYCSISWDATIGAVAHPLTTLSTAAITYKAEYHLIDKDKPFAQKKVLIGNDVWIGCNSTILSGVTIGDGAVIGAGAVVTDNVPSYAIVVGVPAKIIRYRVEPSFIDRLIQVEWWNWNNNVLKQNIHLFEEPVTEELIKKLEMIKDKSED